MRLIRSVVGMLVGGALLVGVVLALTAWRPELNPFRDSTTDRTGASVLQSLTDLSEYHAASAHYETVVDIEEDGGRFVPDFLSGERVLYVGKGDVAAVVDFGELDERRIVLSEDARSVRVTLPQPTVDRPELDLENSYVVLHDEGLINRFRGSELEREAQLRAVEQMTAAAADEGLLLELARENTTSMLEGLFGALEYESVTVAFEGDTG
ncbi:DUF4230 domain-containing protein [Ornithinimicrobium cerasi]|uniref:DUF4230 domain-containing protein n=1 Tax=Ornithinimicrobium cerasi TaxID=2248773 RepID=UPI000F00986B|nr:DUF4230 domain-containing protein [Ornithinimicrobium cerasi]